MCAFGAPASNTFGDSKNGAVRGPGFFNADLSAFKDFRIYQEHSIGFRFDAFNAFNIVSYGNPDTVITDITFSQIASQEQIRSQERRLQFSAKRASQQGPSDGIMRAGGKPSSRKRGNLVMTSEREPVLFE